MQESHEIAANRLRANGLAHLAAHTQMELSYTFSALSLASDFISAPS